jgi:Na+-translocating ferredoxin:NAD+ oxidoreductase RnfC subunit
VDIALLRDTHPAGDEIILVYDVLGRIIPPGGIPLNVGAVVINVETALNIAWSDRQPVVEKFLTIAGAVAEPVTLRVPIGVTLAQCVAAAGGPTIATRATWSAA